MFEIFKLLASLLGSSVDDGPGQTRRMDNFQMDLQGSIKLVEKAGSEAGVHLAQTGASYLISQRKLDAQILKKSRGPSEEP